MFQTLTRTSNLFASAALILALGATALPANADNLPIVNGNRGLQVIGLTANGQLVRFPSGTPGVVRMIGTVSGLISPDTSLIGIDFRVQDGKLYGVGNGGGVYTLDTTNAQATLVNNLSVALSGTSFGVDFNPAADRLRIVSDNGQNLSHNVNAGGTTAAQGTLTYTAPPAAPVAALGVTAAAYTNNDLQSTTATTLFDIDTMLNQISIQSPPGNGILAATGMLGVDGGSQAGFDIYTSLADTTADSARGFASLQVGGVSNFYQVNLLTGKATLIGAFDEAINDIALPLNQ